MKKFIFLFLFLTSFFFIGHISVHAELTYNYTPPCLTPGGCDPITGENALPMYINRLYSFAVGIAGILAVAMIIWGGILYLLSAGKPDMQGQAKDRITSALWGIALLAGSYIILNTVNPEIVKLETPNIETIATSSDAASYDVKRKKCALDSILGYGCNTPENNTQKLLDDCAKAQLGQYQNRVSNCKTQQYSSLGGGAFMYNTTDMTTLPQCHPLYKVFNADKKEMYNPREDNSYFGDSHGDWGFC